MKTKKTILEFKIGKFDAKGKYYQNGGGLKFIGESKGIGSSDAMDKLFPPCFKNGKKKNRRIHGRSKKWRWIDC